LVNDPHDRIEHVRPVVESLGGRTNMGWLSFGDYDVVAVVEMPDNVSAAAFSVALSAGGGCKAFRTTVLLSMAESVEAMKKAQGVVYRGPAAATRNKAAKSAKKAAKSAKSAAKTR
jgi:uncharacterized protein with GYD domain